MNIINFSIRVEKDLTFIRQRIRELAQLAGIHEQGQISLATAASEIVRNCILHADGGEVEVKVTTEESSQSLQVVVRDQGPGIPDVQKVLEPPESDAPGVQGLRAARSLVDNFNIASTEGQGTEVVLETFIPADAAQVTEEMVNEWADALAQSAPKSALEELQKQNQELAKTLDALSKATEEADAANRTKSEFLAKMSHELRTPLNAIAGFAILMQKNKPGNLIEKDLRSLQRIRENCQHLLGLINDILDLSKIEAGRLEVETETFDLTDLVRTTVEQIEGGNSNSIVAISVSLPEAPTVIDSDPVKFKQVLINLVGNALKFTETGTVTVALKTDKSGSPIRLDVVDTGIGIPPEKLGEVFEAFRQVDRNTSLRFGGTGLGLAISKSLCHLMGFELEATSTLGKGSTFSILMQPSTGNK